MFYRIGFDIKLNFQKPYWSKIMCNFQNCFQVGDAIPNVDLFEGTPAGKVNLAELCKEGKTIIFGVPGAFTPGCSKTHLPGK